MVLHLPLLMTVKMSSDKGLKYSHLEANSKFRGKSVMSQSEVTSGQLLPPKELY